MIKAIYAVAKQKNGQYAFGYQNGLPWAKNKQDMKLFKELTDGQIKVCGGKTFLSLPNKVKENITAIFSNDREWREKYKFDRCIMGNMLHSLSYLQDEYPNKDIWVIGGKEILIAALPMIQKQYVSYIDAPECKADVFLDMSVMLKGFIDGENTIFEADPPYSQRIEQTKYCKLGV